MLVMLSATVAPIGSMKMPSNARTDSSGCLGRITASSGPTTVGPETMRIAPMTAARAGGRSNTQYVSSDAPMPVSSAPTVTSPSTGRRAPPRRREKSSFSDSSNSSTRDGHRDQREQVVAEQRVRVDPAEDRPDQQPEEQQQDDRRDAGGLAEQLTEDAEQDDRCDAAGERELHASHCVGGAVPRSVHDAVAAIRPAGSGELGAQAVGLVLDVRRPAR